MEKRAPMAERSGQYPMSPFAGGLGAFEPDAPVFVHRVDIVLEESLDLNALAGRKCRIVIEMGRQAPISLFLMRRP